MPCHHHSCLPCCRPSTANSAPCCATVLLLGRACIASVTLLAQRPPFPGALTCLRVSQFFIWGSLWMMTLRVSFASPPPSTPAVPSLRASTSSLQAGKPPGAAEPFPSWEKDSNSYAEGSKSMQRSAHRQHQLHEALCSGTWSRSYRGASPHRGVR